jgi:hypothetical protein
MVTEEVDVPMRFLVRLKMAAQPAAQATRSPGAAAVDPDTWLQGKDAQSAHAQPIHDSGQVEDQ